MKIEFLGTGTSVGVPQMRCGCHTCTSSDPRDNRMRASAIVYLDDGRNVLIDCGPDFRTQLLRTGCPDLSLALLTHSHYDHVGGIDDLRPYAHTADNRHFPLYCRRDVADDLRARVPYCFSEHPYPGVPTFDIHTVNPSGPFSIGNGVVVTPLPVMHYRLPILGYRIGGLAYITDCKTMPSSTLGLIRGVDTLVINALRQEEHMSHMNLRQALDVITETAPRRAYLTHMSHDMGRQAETERLLPDGVYFAYDGLVVGDIPR